MKVIGGPWEGREVDLGAIHNGMLLFDMPQRRVWVYDRVDTPDGGQLDVREQDGREVDDEKRFAGGEDHTWVVRVVDNGEVDEEVGL
jgi:hypothetical protein